MKNLMLDIPLWVSSSFPIIRIVLFAIVVLCAVLIILTTLFQNEDSNSSDAILGQQESYYSQNKGGSRDHKLKVITTISAIVIAVCVILYFVSFLIYPIGA